MPINQQDNIYDTGSTSVPPLEAKMPLTWKILTQKHDEYDAVRVQKLQLLLQGGYDIVKSAKLFMPKWQSESLSAYKDRLSFASYENNFGEIINDLSATLFSRPLQIVPATDADEEETPGEEPNEDEPFMQWQRHFTLDEKPMADFLRHVQNEANALTTAYFGVDLVDSKPYAYHIDPCSILDWECDDAGHFILLVMRNDECTRTNVRQVRDSITTTFTVWTKQDDKVSFDQYQITYPKNEEPSEDKLVPHLANDLVVPFKEIPIIACTIPDNLSVGQLIGQLASSLFSRYSTFLFCLNRGINPILVYKQGFELPAKGDLSIINEDEERGEDTTQRASHQGKAVIGPNDDLEWVEPAGKALAIVQEQLTFDKNEMYRLVSSLNSLVSKQGVSTAQTKASGVAKMIDNTAKEHLLEAYAHLVKGWAQQAFHIIYQALGQDVIWQLKGMDNYKTVDATELQAKIAALPIYKAVVPSKTSYKQVCLDTAYEMHPFTNIGVLNTIQKEISENIDKMEDEEFGRGEVAAQPATQEAQMEQDKASAANKAQTAGKTPASSSPSNAAQPAPQIGQSGNQALPPGSHMQTGQHIEWQVVYDILDKDYKPADLDTWVKLVPWRGPVEVDISDISFQGQDEWSANKPGANGTDKVDKYAEIMADQGMAAFKPVILANMPQNNEPYTIIDGRHRVKASEKSGVPILAYIADVSSMDDDTPHMQLHSKQIGKSS